MIETMREGGRLEGSLTYKAIRESVSCPEWFQCAYSPSLEPWVRAQSRAKVDARKNFLLVYFLYTYCLSKSDAASCSINIRAPGNSCVSV